MMQEEGERDISFAFKPLPSFPIPSAADIENITHIDLTECNVKDGFENLR